MDATEQFQSWPATITSSGRITIPSEARQESNWHDGIELVIRRNINGYLEIITRDQFVREVQSYFAHKFEGRNVVEELLAERREEAQRDQSGS